LAHEASQTGHPLVRPYFWEMPESPDTWDVDDTFFVGPSMLVAPVLHKGMTRRAVPLPAGDWYDFWNDNCFAGPTRLTVDLPLDRIGLFVREGSILPLEEDGGIVLHLYAPSSAPALPPRRSGEGEVGGADEGADVPGSEGAVLSRPSEGPEMKAGAGLLYRDAGDGYGPSRLDRFLVGRAGDRLVVERLTEGAFEPAGVPMRLALHGASARHARVDGVDRAVEQDLFVVGEFERVEIDLE